MSGSNPWLIANGKAPVRDKANAAGDAAGRTFREVRPHATRTNEKNPGIVVKVPTELYTAASPTTRAGMRALVEADLKRLAEEDKKDEANRQRQRTSYDGSRVAGASSSSNLQDNAQNSGDVVQKNKRGQRIPDASPDNVLTGDRDGSEHAKVLVSPISYGRTRHAARTHL
jgi:hypothetical protein